jgi:hypothetical protein
MQYLYIYSMHISISIVRVYIIVYVEYVHDCVRKCGGLFRTGHARSSVGHVHTVCTYMEQSG